MRYQGYSGPTGEVDEPESSAYVEIDRSNPVFSLDCSDLPSLTRQEFADECDINVLMARYEATGLLPTMNKGEPQYLDLSDVPDFREALDLLADANRSFMSLPAKIRKEFDNDPVKFVDFAENPENLEKLREWKLAPPAYSEPPPQRVEVVNPPEAPDPAAK